MFELSVTPESCSVAELLQLEIITVQDCETVNDTALLAGQLISVCGSCTSCQFMPV
jgi:hypothetical protein